MQSQKQNRKVMSGLEIVAIHTADQAVEITYLLNDKDFYKIPILQSMIIMCRNMLG